MKMKKSISVIMSVSLVWWNLSFAAPEGGVVAAGSAAISQNGNTTQITQTSQNAVINWQGFNTAAHEAVNFSQPNASAIALNRINSGLPTSFAGTLTANGNVWVVNPAGVLFTGTSRIDVGGLLATTANITDSNFMSGNYHFQQAPNLTSSVINNGEIKAQGLVALVAPNVENNGVIQANLGKVVLGSGAEYTVDMYGDGLISFAAANTERATVSNNGAIYANGGQVLLTAKAASDVVDNVISMKGVIEAKNITQTKSGVIILGGDNNDVYVNGKIDVSGQNGGGNVSINARNITVDHAAELKADAINQGNGGNIIMKANNQMTYKGSATAKGGASGGDGGLVETSGNYLAIDAGSSVNASATTGLGKAGTWLLDPIDITIDGTLAGIIETTLAGGTNYIVETNVPGGDAGNILVQSSINANSTNNASLTLNAVNNIDFNSGIDITINGGNFVATSGGAFHLNNSSVVTADAITINAGSQHLSDLPVTAGQYDPTKSMIWIESNAGLVSTAGDINITTPTIGLLNDGGFIDSGTAGFDTIIHINSTHDFVYGAPTSDPLTQSGLVSSTNGFNGENTSYSGIFAQNLVISADGNIYLDNGNGFAPFVDSSSIANSVSFISLNGDINVAAGDMQFMPDVILNAAGNVNLSGSILTFTADNDLSIIAGGDVNFGNGVKTRVTGNLSASADGQIISNVTNIPDPDNIIVNGLTSYTANGGAGIQTNVFDQYNGAVSLFTAADIDAVLHSETLVTTIGTSDVGGDLTVNGRQIAQTGAVVVHGTSTLTSSSGAINLSNANNDFIGDVFLTAGSDTFNGNAFIADINDISFGTSSVDFILDVNAGGNITQTGVITANIFGDYSIFTSTGGDITLTNTGNSFNTLSVNTSGSPSYDATIAYNPASTLNLAASSVSGNFTFTGGNLVQSGGLVVGGNTLINVGAHAINLTNASNDFVGSVSLNNSGVNNAAIVDINNLILGTSSIGNDLSATFNGTLSQAGSLTVPGNLSIIAGAPNVDVALNTFANDLNTVSFAGAGSYHDVAIQNNNVLNLAGLTASGILDVTADGITQSAPLFITGLATFNSGSSSINLSGANDFSSVVLTTAGTGNAVVNDINDLVLDSVNVGGDLTINSGGAVTQINPLHSQLLDVTAVNGIILDNQANQPIVFTAINTTSGDIIFNNSDPLTITGIDQQGTGNISINNFGSINIINNPIQTNGGFIFIYSDNGVGSIFVNQPITSGGGSGGNLIIGQNVTFGGSGSTFLGGGNITINIPLPPVPPVENPDPTLPPNWWGPTATPVCTGNDCAPIEINLALGDDSEPQVGVVNCVVGFAIIQDQNGNERILVPGDKVYLNEKIVTDGMSSVTLSMNSGKIIKMGANQALQMGIERA